MGGPTHNVVIHVIRFNTYLNSQNNGPVHALSGFTVKGYVQSPQRHNKSVNDFSGTDFD